MLDVIVAYAVNNLCYITGQSIVPCGIVIHSTGVNNPYLKRYVDAPNEVGINNYNNHWNVATPGGKKVCVHSFIGYDKNKNIRVANILPYNICCWGVGNGKKGSYNYKPAYIQIEICEDSLQDKAYFQKSFAVAAEYCAELCKIYHIPINNIVSHKEAHSLGYGSNHSDPEHWMKRFNTTMNDFRRTVAQFVKSKNPDVKNVSNNFSEEVINEGDLVSISEDAVYYNNVAIPKWVKSQNWYVKSISPGNKAVIDKNEIGTHFICSPIRTDFLMIVKKNGCVSTVTEYEHKPCPYLIKVTAECLNIRKDAGTNFEIVGKIIDKGVYTITAEKTGAGANLWGKLKSGLGWISLDYVKVV